MPAERRCARRASTAAQPSHATSETSTSAEQPPIAEGGSARHARCVERAVCAANELDERPGERIALMKVALGADEVPAAKPAADGLLLCCEKLGVEPSLSVYVGDSPSDGKAAAAAGMKSIGVLWGANPKEKLEGHFETLVQDVPALIVALREALTPKVEVD